MSLVSPGGGSGDLILKAPEGRSDRYQRQADGSFQPPPAVYTTLAKNGDGSYTATLQDQSTWSFDSSGRLSSVGDRYGNRSTLNFNVQGQLSSVGDPAGRGSLTFGYNGSGLLTSVTDWASPARSVQYGYDVQGRLQTVTDRAGKVTSYPENPV
jgi:YD repeat-containing protein